MRGSTVAKWFARLSLCSLCCCPCVDVSWLPIGKKEIYGRNTRNTCCFSAQSSVKGPRSHGVWTHTWAIYRAHTHTQQILTTPPCVEGVPKKEKKSPSIFALTENPIKNIIIIFFFKWKRHQVTGWFLCTFLNNPMHQSWYRTFAFYIQVSFDVILTFVFL